MDSERRRRLHSGPSRGAQVALSVLLASADPTVRYKARTLLLGEAEDSPEIRRLRRSIATTARAQALLQALKPGPAQDAPYRKWQGPHWSLYQLALIDYPPGDRELLSLRERVYAWFLEPAHLKFPRSLAIPGQEERFRHCASMEGNAIWYSIRLGIDDERTQEFARRLAGWQWPDGGWNCDKRPQARSSSVIESLIPLRGLALAARTWSDKALIATISRAAEDALEYFLSRRLFRRLRDGRPIEPSWGDEFDRIHYPIAFYDLLFALVVMAEAGAIRDPRCAEALDLLEAKRLPDGGFPAELRTARTSAEPLTRGSYADWGAFGRRRSNELVTVEALYALKEAGRAAFC